MDREEDQRVAAALRRQGLDVSSVWDLVHTADDYRDVVPLLVTMLNRTTDYDVKEGIVRALSLKSFRSPAFEALVSALEDLFDDMSPRADTLKWAIGNALSVQATKEDGEKLTTLQEQAEIDPGRCVGDVEQDHRPDERPEHRVVQAQPAADRGVGRCRLPAGRLRVLVDE